MYLPKESATWGLAQTNETELYAGLITTKPTASRPKKIDDGARGFPEWGGGGFIGHWHVANQTGFLHLKHEKPIREPDTPRPRLEIPARCLP